MNAIWLGSSSSSAAIAKYASYLHQQPFASKAKTSWLEFFCEIQQELRKIIYKFGGDLLNGWKFTGGQLELAEDLFAIVVGIFSRISCFGNEMGAYYWKIQSDRNGYALTIIIWLCKNWLWHPQCVFTRIVLNFTWGVASELHNGYSQVPNKQGGVSENMSISREI